MNYYLIESPSDKVPLDEQGLPLPTMLVEDFYASLARKAPVLAFDTETTGLRPFHGDRAFALAFSDGECAWYWDVQGRPLPARIRELFLDKTWRWYGHNIKFDCHQVRETFGVSIAGTLHDTAIGARIEFNDHPSYDLDSCLKRIGLEKRDAVAAYVKEHGLKTDVPVPHKKEPRRILHYDRVPVGLMFLYACDDARGTYRLAIKQLQKIQAVDALLPESPPGMSVVALERQLMPVVVELERGGVLVDKEYCEKAIEHLTKESEQKRAEFKEATGQEFKDSWQALSKVFEDQKLKWGRTEKGNPSFGSDVLETFDGVAAKCVLALRNAKSRVDFFATFLAESDSAGYVHPSFNSGGTATRRFSSSGPNFQNLTNDEDAPVELFSPRRALVAPPDHCIAVFDYKQQEYALMLDYAGEMEIIREVKAGADIHQATADLMGVTRRAAKTLNFMLLYGGGVAKLCMALFKPSVDFETLQAICFLRVYQMTAHDDVEKHLSLVRDLPESVIEYNCGELAKAQELRELYFSKLPNVKRFIKTVIETGEMRGYVHNWAGMRYWCHRRFSYVLPNRIIQGGGAEIGKRAMVACAELLAGCRSRLFLPVHDELDFYLHRDELELAGRIRSAMEGIYPARHLPMRVDCSHSWSNLGDLKDGAP